MGPRDLPGVVAVQPTQSPERQGSEVGVPLPHHTEFHSKAAVGKSCGPQAPAPCALHVTRPPPERLTWGSEPPPLSPCLGLFSNVSVLQKSLPGSCFPSCALPPVLCLIALPRDACPCPHGPQSHCPGCCAILAFSDDLILFLPSASPCRPQPWSSAAPS